MILKIKKNIIKHRRIYIIGSILLVSFLLMIWHSINYTLVWWDEAVYVGMGKYIISGGKYGIWEIFRPPFLPLIYALLYKLGLPLIFAGKVIVVIFSVGSILFVYLLGEKIKKYSGIFASIFLLITPVFFFFSKIVLTDIISIFFVILAFWLLAREKYLWVGISVAIAFLFRFPQGLVLLPIGIIIIYDTYNKNFILWLKELFIKGFYVGIGFAILIVPFLISNYLLYGDLIKPIVLGSNFIGVNGFNSYLYDFGISYYFTRLFFAAPFLFLSIFIPIIFYQKNFFINNNSRRILWIVSMVAITFLFYFSWQPHKELRYGLAFVPYFAILSGVSFVFILNYFKQKRLIIILFVIFVIFFGYKSKSYYINQSGNSYVPLYNDLNNLKGLYLSTTPIPVVFSNVHIELFDSFNSFHDLFIKKSDSLDGVILNSCDIFCIGKSYVKSCDEDIEAVHSEIMNSSLKKNNELIIDNCIYSIYKK